jgi:hypothetical protein
MATSESFHNMAIRHEFEPDAGYRFFKDEVSILLHSAARFRQGAIVTNVDLFNFFRHLNRFLQRVGAYEVERQGVSDLMRADDFQSFKEIAFYKFMPEKTLEYYLRGSFQFGSVQYYRTIEQQNSKDAMEGLSNIAIKTPQHLFAMSLASGHNFGIFCGTSSLGRQDEMSKRFGPRIIKITNLKNFAEDMQRLLGAKRFYFNHVIYNDLKLFRTETPKPIHLPSDKFDPRVVDDAIFDLLYEASFLSSLFMKPTRFSIEEELRLVFEMPKDVPPPHVLRLTDTDLLNHIEVI